MNKTFGLARGLLYIHVMMNQEDIYQAEQELARYNELMSQEILNQEEYEFCKAWDAEEAKNLFHNSWNNTYLNLNVYSEVEKEKHDLRKEMGV